MKCAVSGPFDPTYSRSQSVDFSSLVSGDTYHVILPLRAVDDPWSYFYPFDCEIWIFSLCIIPIYILLCALADHIYFHNLQWFNWFEFVIRNFASEGHQSYKRIFGTLNNKKLSVYQKLLILSWTWFCFILIKSYSGNLTAMIARPKLNMKFTKAKDLLHQQEVALTIEDGVGAIEYMSRSPPGSAMRKLIEKTERVDPERAFFDCFSKSHQQSGRHAAICDVVSIKSRLSNDFTAHGHCNWYLMEQKLFASSSVMAFQVNITTKCS